MKQTLKIVIPTAGWGTRMRPQTWSKPKPLVSVAGKAALDHLLDTFRSLPPEMEVEYIIILGPYLGESQIPAYMQEQHPDLKVAYAVQPVMKGQSDALWLGRNLISGPTIVIYSDTLIETDFSFLTSEPNDAVAWVKPVPDPRRFGVAEVDSSGQVLRLIEKPASLDNNRVVVGCYYFREGRDLIAAIEEQMRRGVQLKGEYFLADAINIYLETGRKRMRVEEVETWLDTGTIAATLETNRYLLERLQNSTPGSSDASPFQRAGVQIVAPVFIHETAEIHDAVIGPYASIGPGCKIEKARIDDSILEAGAAVESAALTGSFIGCRAQVRGRSAEAPPLRLNIGDDSSVLFE
jgi:glucose-1-phosphate thymidylyltransferase